MKGLAWGGNTTWQIWSGQGTGTPGSFTCPGFLPSRLRVGGRGRVVDGLGANRLRSHPSTTGRLLDEIPPGGTFAVLNGPQCGEGLAWWQVEYRGLVGWTAEGEGSTYWLEPVP
jgi:hypothetical protein